MDRLGDRVASARSAATRLVGLVALVVIWQVAAVVADTPWFPPFTTVLTRIAELFSSGRIQPALVVSLGNLVVGYVVAVIVGVTMGTAMALSERVEWALRSYIDALLFVPPVVFAPIFFAFFGLSSLTLVLVVFVFSVFVITVNTQTAVAATDPALVDVAASFGATRTRVLREVTFPAALPVIFSGLQLGMGRAVKGMIVGELFITIVGLGGLERRFSSSFDAPGIWAIAVVVIAIALLLTALIQLLDRRINSWAR